MLRFGESEDGPVHISRGQDYTFHLLILRVAPKPQMYKVTRNVYSTLGSLDHIVLISCSR